MLGEQRSIKMSSCVSANPSATYVLNSQVKEHPASGQQAGQERERLLLRVYSSPAVCLRQGLTVSRWLA